MKLFKRKESLTNRFGLIISTYVLITVLFLSAFYSYSYSILAIQAKNEQIQNIKSVSNIIVSIIKEDINKKDFKRLTNISNYFIKNNLILYTAIVDKKNNTYIWASDKNLISTKTDINNPNINKIYNAKYSKFNPAEIIQIKHELNGNYGIIGFYDNKKILDILDVMLRGNIVLAVMFIAFSMLSASFLAKLVTTPIKKLDDVAKEFAKGNLTHRAEVKTNDEIGSLSKSFNLMAKNLQELYTSLEEKVLERTKEIDNKNKELEKAYEDLKEAEAIMLHNEKMTSLGELVAGIAHELNNPINFVHGNLAHLKEYSNDLIKIIETYEKAEDQINEDNKNQVLDIKNEIDYDFIKSDLPELLKSCQEGTKRCAQIVLDLKNFARLDEASLKESNVEDGIESTLNILNNKLKDKVTIHKDYGIIPPLMCNAGQLNQVFMNLIDNAAQSIEEKGDLFIKTEHKNDEIIITFEDTGAGIDKENLEKIFEPFFTTKKAGHGSGLGLTISYKIIKSHNGNISVQSEKGKGSKFIINIPVNWYNEKIISG